MTNYLKTAVDHLISLIKTQYPRFIDPGRIAKEIQSNDEIYADLSMFGHEDCMIIVPDPDIAEESLMILTSMKEIAKYSIKILYYKPGVLIFDQDGTMPFDEVTDFAETFENWLKNNYMHVADKWVGMETQLNYNVPIPDRWTEQNPDARMHGFELSITFNVGKY